MLISFKTKFIFFLLIFCFSIPINFVSGSEETVLYLKFDEGDGTVVFDSSNYRNNGTVNNAFWELNKCIDGSCLFFNNFSSYASVNQHASLNPQNFTIEAWIYSFGGTGNRTIVNKDTNGPATRAWRLHLDSNENDKLVADFQRPIGLPWAVVYSNKSIKNNTWYYVAATYNHSYFCVWINSVLSGCLLENSDIDYRWTQSKLIIGMSEDSSNKKLEYFNGIIDEVKISNYAKNYSQLFSIYNEFCPNDLCNQKNSNIKNVVNPLIITSAEQRNVLSAVPAKAPVLVADSITPEVMRFIEDYKPDWIYTVGFSSGLGNSSRILYNQVPGLFFPNASRAVYVNGSSREKGILASQIAYYLDMPVVFERDGGSYSEIIDLENMSLQEIGDFYINLVKEDGRNIDYLVLTNFSSSESLLAGRLAGMRNGYIIPLENGSYEGVMASLRVGADFLGSHNLYHKNVMYKTGKPLYLALLGSNESIPHIPFFDPGLEIFDNKDGWWLYSDVGYSDLNGDGYYDLALGRMEGLEAASLHLARQSVPKNQSVVLIGEYRHGKFEDLKFFGSGMSQVFAAQVLLGHVNVSTKRIVEEKLSSLDGIGNSSIYDFFGKFNTIVATMIAKNMVKGIALPWTVAEYSNIAMYAILEYDWNSWAKLLGIIPVPRHLDSIEADLAERIGSPGVIGYFGMGEGFWLIPNNSRSYMELLLNPYSRAVEFDNITFSGFLYDDHDVSAKSVIKEKVLREGGSVMGSSGIVHDPYNMHTSTMFFICLAQGKPLGQAFMESVNTDPLTFAVGFFSLYMAYSNIGQEEAAIAYPLLYSKDKLERILWADPAATPLERRYSPQKAVYKTGPANSFIAEVLVAVNRTGQEVLNADTYLAEPEKPLLPVYYREFVLPEGSFLNWVNVTGNYSLENSGMALVYNDSHYTNWTEIIVGCIGSLGFSSLQELDAEKESLIEDCVDNLTRPDVSYPYPNVTFWWKEARLLDNRTIVMVFIPAVIAENESHSLFLESATVQVGYEASMEMNVFAQDVFLGENATVLVELMNMGNEVSGNISIFVEGNGSLEFLDEVTVLGNSNTTIEFSFQPSLGEHEVTAVFEGDNGIGPRYAYFSVHVPPALFVGDIPEIEVNEGEEAEFHISLKNTAGFLLENISVVYEGPFEVEPYSNGFDFEGYGNIILDAYVKVPESYLPGRYSGLVNFFPSNDKKVTANLTFIVPARASFDVQSNMLAEAIKPESYQEIIIPVHNTGNVPLALKGYCEGFDGISCSFFPDDLEVLPGQQGMLYANISVDGGHQSGLFSGTIRVSGEGVSKEMALGVDVLEAAYWEISPLEWHCRLPGCVQDFLVSSSPESNMPLELDFITGNLSLFFDDFVTSVLPGESKNVTMADKVLQEGFAAGIYEGEIRVAASLNSEPAYNTIKTKVIAEGPEFTLEKEFSPDSVMLFWKQFVAPRVSHVEIYLNNIGDVSIDRVRISDEIPDGWKGKKPVISFAKRNKKSMVKDYMVSYENGQLNLSFNFTGKPLLKGEGLEIHYMIYALPETVPKQGIITQTVGESRSSQNIYSVAIKETTLKVEYFDPPQWLRWLFVMIYRLW